MVGWGEFHRAIYFSKGPPMPAHFPYLDHFKSWRSRVFRGPANSERRFTLGFPFLCSSCPLHVQPVNRPSSRSRRIRPCKVGSIRIRDPKPEETRHGASASNSLAWSQFWFILITCLSGIEGPGMSHSKFLELRCLNLALRHESLKRRRRR